MPKWAIISIYAVLTAVVSGLASLLTLQISQSQHWEIGTSALIVAFANLTVVALSLTILGSVFRFWDRRQR